MFRKPLVSVVLATLTLAGAFLVARPAESAAVPVRIMPLGDSITGGPGCWRALLWDRLQRTGFTDIDFVGTLPGGGCSVAHDGDNEGHGGFQAVGIANQNQLPGWLAATRPDVVLMHLGTNDIWGNTPAATILAAYNTLVDQMRASNPSMRIIVAQIIPMAPSGCTWCSARRERAEQRHSRLGRRPEHRAVAHHRRRPVHRVRPGRRHQRRWRAPR
jgi:hypothetical protein